MCCVQLALKGVLCTISAGYIGLLVLFLPDSYAMLMRPNAPINFKPAGGVGRWGIGWDFDIFQKITVKFPTPGAKM